ncbi:FecR family protein [Bacteroides uniformis]|nr:FecR family protein [Bacteroides uniformis]
MKKSVPWNLIIPKLKQEISADEERQLETWLRSSNNEALFKELQLLWEKIQANVENYTPNTEYYWNELANRMHASEPKQTEKPAKKRFELKRIYRYAVAACIAVAIGCSFYIGFLNGQPEAMPQLYSNLSGKSKVLLPDGSEVWMHTETSLQYESQMNKDERIVNVTW